MKIKFEFFSESIQDLLEVDPNMNVTVGQIKEMIADGKTNVQIPKDKQILICCGKELNDDTKQISDYGSEISICVLNNRKRNTKVDEPNFKQVLSSDKVCSLM